MKIWATDILILGGIVSAVFGVSLVSTAGAFVAGGLAAIVVALLIAGATVGGSKHDS